MGQVQCWKCHHPVDGTIKFKTNCDRCGSYLHCCKGCKHYQIGKPNDCNIPNTDAISNREHLNYCEAFQPVTDSSSKSSLSDIEKRLFKD